MRASLLLALSLYVMGVVLGALNPINISLIFSSLAPLISATPLQFALYILANNLATSILMALSGFLIVPPAFMIFLNGLVLGSTLRYALTRYTIVEVAYLILPHGVFEIPALLLSAEAGIDVALSMLEKGFRETLLTLDSIANKLGIVSILLLVAAIIETVVAYLH